MALGWQAGALERDRAALAAYAAEPPPLYVNPRNTALAAIAAATEAAHAKESVAVDVACNSPPSTRTTAAAAEPPPLRSREHRLKSALAALQLEKRIARRAAAKAATRSAIADDAVWGPNRE
jgi:hypothetical protein